MEKRQISIVYNPQNKGKNRKKTQPNQVKADPIYYCQSKKKTQKISLVSSRPASKCVDTQNVKFIYNKKCPYAEIINGVKTSIVEQFCQNEKLRNCKECYRTAILCNGINDIDNYDKYRDLFIRHKVTTELLYKLFIESKAKATIKGNLIEIHCHEDTWRIYPKIGSIVVDLRHNNYVRNFFGERHFAQGYHEQNIADKTFVGALEYIMDYDYNKLHNPEKTLTRNVKKVFKEEFEKALTERSN